MADSVLTFDADTHTYRLRGVVVPSVTQVLAPLEDFGGVSADVLARAAEFGQHVHQAVSLHIQGRLDRAALDPLLEPYLVGAERFLRDCVEQVIASELPVYSEPHQVAGTLDLFAKIRGWPAIVDWKTSFARPRTVGPQTAGYALLLRASTDQAAKRRYCVRLLPNDYRVDLLSDPADQTAFLSCLNIAKWRTRNG